MLILVWIRSQVHPDDYNTLSVVEYAVGTVGVKHGKFELISSILNSADKTSSSSDRRWTHRVWWR